MRKLARAFEPTVRCLRRKLDVTGEAILRLLGRKCLPSERFAAIRLPALTTVDSRLISNLIKLRGALREWR